MTHPPFIGRHGFDLDCEFFDGPTYRERWRRRWNCSCGAKGTWYSHGEDEVHLEWREHAEAMTRLAQTRLAGGQWAVSA